MALCINSRITPAVKQASFGYGVVTVGSDCFLDQVIESANDQVCYSRVVERVIPSRLNLEDYVRVGVADNVDWRESVVGNVVESRWCKVTAELQGWCCCYVSLCEGAEQK